MAIYSAFRRVKSTQRIWSDKMTAILSSISHKTSVIYPFFFVVRGTHKETSCCFVVFLFCKDNHGTPAFCSCPFVGSKESHTISPWSGILSTIFFFFADIWSVKNKFMPILRRNSFDKLLERVLFVFSVL